MLLKKGRKSFKKSLRKDVKPRARALRPATSDAADPITETPAPSEAVPDNKEARKSKKSKKFKKPKAIEKN